MADPETPDIYRDLRADYGRAALDEATALADPFAQFDAWYKDAVAAKLPDPNAMTLATVAADGQPSVRTVLLRGVEPGAGFIFYTNYASRKGREIDASPAVALLFFWAELERQVRIEGRAERVATALSDEYFASRPRGSQLAAVASPQSEPLADRAELERRVAEAEARFAGRPVERPPHWGGYIVRPARFEFWQGGANRLHDRLVYERDPANKAWRRHRLAP